MKITNEHVARLLEARLARIQRASQPPRQHGVKATESDRAVFSSRHEDLRVGLAAARASARQVGAVRPSFARQVGAVRPSFAQTEDPRLDSLARQVRAGSYRVPPQQVADALLRDLKGH